jgi:protoporphyrinogen oxidase
METTSVREVSCDLCIVGAGIAGLNAFFAASRYLGRNHTVVLIDRKPRAGGM